MWFLGMLLGAAVGSSWGIKGIFSGGVLGLIAGAVIGAQRNGGTSSQPNASATSSSTEQRLRLLEAQVDWLRRELAAMRGEPVTESLPQAAVAPSVDEAVTLSQTEAREIPPEPLMAQEVVEDAAEKAVEDAAPELTQPAWWSKLLAGNLLAKIGVVLLFFGVASGLRLAAEHGMIPVQLRLLLGAVGGIAMLLFGWSRVQQAKEQSGRRVFGLAVQGGGFAILYLVVYFMLARYQLIGATAGFGLFAALGVACVLLAAKQDGELLAVFGISGAFLAPILASTGGGDPRLLFSYFAMMNVFVLGVSWFRSWKVLNVAGFILTLVVGMAWAIDQYRPQYYGVAQSFLVLFCVMYSAASPLTALLRAPGRLGWSAGVLVFGTPLAASFLQSQLMPWDHDALAWCAVGAGIYYLGWWALLYRRPEAEIRLLERSTLGIAIAFLTVAVPLAFGAQVTSAMWAIEGVAVLWFGVRQGRRLAQGFGVLMQFLSGGWFLDGLSGLGHAQPVFNDQCIGGLLIFGAGFVGARLLRQVEISLLRPVLSPALLLAWALLWWFGTGWNEIEYFATHVQHVPLFLLFSALSFAALEFYGAQAGWGVPRHAGLLLVPLLWAATLWAIAQSGHVLAGSLTVILPVAIVLNTWMIKRQDRDAVTLWGGLRHVVVYWLLLFVVTAELAWVAHRLSPGVSLWPLLAWGVMAAIGLRIARAGLVRDVWPFSAQPVASRAAVCLPLILVAGFWSLFANYVHAGGGTGLPYIPLINPFDLAQIFVLFSLYSHSDFVQKHLPSELLRALLALLGFVWISALAARIAHHWGGVPFDPDALYHSALLQGMLTLLWSALAIGLMIRATRQRSRQGWFVGFGLLAVVGVKLLAVDLSNSGTGMWSVSLIGVAVLVLAASYFAPVPPKAPEMAEDS